MTAKLKIILGIVLVSTIVLFSFAKEKENPNPEPFISSLNIQNEDTLQKLPTVLVKNKNNHSRPIQLEQLKVDVSIVGNIATTTMEMVFYNDYSRVLEGELYFPLKDGQTISRFALDVNGKMREAVAVEKNKGQVAFENTIRQQIDPGLLEWAGGNNFKARIYPIPSKGRKKMIVAYEEELPLLQNAFLYQLPLQTEEKIKDFQLNVTVFKQDKEPVLYQSDVINFQFQKWEENYRSEYKKKNFSAKEMLSFAVPNFGNNARIYTQKIPGEDGYYFYTTIEPQKLSYAEIKMNEISLIWDASRSSENRNIDKEIQFLEQAVTKLGITKITLYELRNELEKVGTLSINEVKSHVQKIQFDGASAYKKIDFSKLKGDGIFIFGDGLSNFGKEINQKNTTPIYCVNSSTSFNPSYFKYLSQSSGGKLINLVSESLTEATNRIMNQGTFYLGNSLQNSYPSIPTEVSSVISVAGKINGAQEIIFTYGNGATTETKTIFIDPEKHSIDNINLGRVWAQKKLAELDINYTENKKEIEDLGRAFNLVTQNTSLIVLDRVEDYVTHKIVPPAELLEKYNELLAQEQQQKQQETKSHLEIVEESFKEYAHWWDTYFNVDSILLADKQRQKVSTDSITVEDLQQIPDANADGVASTVGGVTIEELEEVTVSAYNVEVQSTVAREADVVNSEDRRRNSGAKKSASEKAKAKIQIEAWEPDAEYMKTLKGSNENIYREYLKLAKEHGTTPAFFLDISDLLIKEKKKGLAIRVLSNIAEMELQNHELMRVLAHRLEQLNELEDAISLYEKVMEIRKEEPQSYRDLGLCLSKNKQYDEAVQTLKKVVDGNWHNRFPGIETIVLTEINRILALHPSKVNATIEDRFKKEMPVDIRVIINWDSDNCDMDLWVTDPRNEKCFYSHKLTEIGGRISNDFTQGYGPEIFDIKKAMKGEYKVQVNYYGTSSQKMAAPTTIQVQLITNYGRPNEKVQEVTRRLSTSKEVLDIGSLLIE